MKTEIGEYIVGAYLQVIKGCDYINYNVRPPGGGLEGLDEIDVVGFDLKSNTVYLCEVKTHIKGLNHERNINKIKLKYRKQKKYSNKYLKNFKKRHFMFWSPVVRQSVVDKLKKVKNIEMIVGKEYTKCIDELREKAKKMANDTGNPFFRSLQILERLKR